MSFTEEKLAKQKATKRRYYVKHREAKKEYARQYRIKYADKAHASQKRSRENNLEARKEKARQWAAANPEKRKESARQWTARNPDKIRRRCLNRYGLTPEMWDALFEAQGRRCKICRSDTPTTKRGWHVDHCHNSNTVRGILCQKCNQGLGNFRDSVDFLVAAAAYLAGEKNNDDAGQIVDEGQQHIVVLPSCSSLSPCRDWS
jgi:hypothetical protein